MSRGNRVVGFDLVFDNLVDLKDHPNLSCFPADITNDAAIPAAAGDAGVLVHCAALVHKRSSDLSRENYFRINHLGTRNVLGGLNPSRLKKIIFLSTVSVYGTIPPGTEPDESSPTRPDDFYGESKLAAEEEIRIFSGKHGISHTILRLSPVYGRSFLLNIHKRIYLPGQRCFYRLGEGNQKLSLCSVNNLVEVICTGVA